MLKSNCIPDEKEQKNEGEVIWEQMSLFPTVSNGPFVFTLTLVLVRDRRGGLFFQNSVSLEEQIMSSNVPINTNFDQILKSCFATFGNSKNLFIHWSGLSLFDHNFLFFLALISIVEKAKTKQICRKLAERRPNWSNTLLPDAKSPSTPISAVTNRLNVKVSS